MSLGRDGKILKHSVARNANVPVLNGMRSRTRNGETIVGFTETQIRNAPDASGQTFMDSTVMGGKRLTPPRPIPGMRSRTSDASDLHTLGKAILEQAILKTGGK